MNGALRHKKWRKRVGIEPTDLYFRKGPPVLKTGGDTSPHSLPLPTISTKLMVEPNYII